MALVRIPLVFFGVDSAIYLVAALIGFFVAYYAYRTYDLTRQRQHFYLTAGFIILSLGFLTLALSSLFGYLSLSAAAAGTGATIFDNVFDAHDFGYWIYYVLSVVAYLCFAVMYLPGKAKIPGALVVVPLWFEAYPFFHLLSFVLIAFVVMRTAINFLLRKSTRSFLVAFAFGCFAIFHALLLLSALRGLIYVLAHGFLFLGTIALLLVLMQLRRTPAARRSRGIEMKPGAARAPRKRAGPF